MKILEIEHLTVSYEKRPALTDISFQVEEGDYLTIVGENGSGKSTLIKNDSRPPTARLRDYHSQRLSPKRNRLFAAECTDAEGLSRPCV